VALHLRLRAIPRGADRRSGRRWRPRCATSSREIKVASLGNGTSAGPTAYIDTNSAEVQQLKSAALPLIMRLNDEQKREVKSMAYIMGLESVASLF
jgi:hypothetical protein